MGHYGETRATFMTGDESAIMSLGFQMRDIQMPLAAVQRIAEKGNLVQCAPKDEVHFLQSIATNQKRIAIVRKRGSHAIAADYVALESGFGGQAMI